MTRGRHKTLPLRCVSTACLLYDSAYPLCSTGAAGSGSAGLGGLTLLRLLLGGAAVFLSYWTSDIMGPTDPAQLALYHAADGPACRRLVCWALTHLEAAAGC